MDRETTLFELPNIEGEAMAPRLVVSTGIDVYPTPCYVAEHLLAQAFPELDSDDVVLEPGCGPGRFLQIIPAHVPAIGVEIDPVLAQQARDLTGRRVICGDFRTVSIDVAPTACIGNPPFDLKLIDDFLARCYRLLPEGGRAGFILPAYAFQTAGRVVRYSDSWSISQCLIPRNIYPGLSLPLVWATFSKDRRRTLVGFACYHETVDVKRLPGEFRRLLEEGSSRGMWRAVVEEALQLLGGEGDLEAIYRTVEGRRPTRTQFWREQIRKQLRAADFIRTDRGRYALRAAA